MPGLSGSGSRRRGDAASTLHRVGAGLLVVVQRGAGSEYGDLRYTPAHQLTVDAYAVQHPGLPERRTAQSIAIHLVGLCLSLERGRGPMELPRLRQRLAPPRRIFPWLPPPGSLGGVTVADVHATQTPEAHRETVGRWARSAWEAWSPHHSTVRAWADELG
ncbi:MAG TPA: DUF5946 family protein [Candidatus Limnocylindria bacterium]